VDPVVTPLVVTPLVVTPLVVTPLVVTPLVVNPVTTESMGVNPVIVISIIIIVILVIVLIVMITRAIISSHQTVVDGGDNTTNLPPCANIVNTANLLVIPDDQLPCHEDTITTLYYIGNLSQGTLDFVVSPTTNSYTNVCAGFCASITNGQCNGPTYAGQTAQQNYTACINTLNSFTPSDSNGKMVCVAPAPVAIKGDVLYYPFAPTCRSCDSCTG
jgi:hypothetical protein